MRILNLIYLFIVFVLGLFLYYYSLVNGSFIFDDFKILLSDSFIIKDISFKNFSKNIMSYGRLLRVITYYFDYHIWGLNPFGYRLTNLIIHIFNSFLLYLFLKLIYKNQIYTQLISTIFLVFPIFTSTVCFITARKELLGVSFTLLSFLMFFKYNENNKKIYLILSFFFYFICILSKESFVAVFLLIIIYDFYIYRKRKYYIYLTFLFIFLLGLYYSAKHRPLTLTYQILNLPIYFFDYIRLFFDMNFFKIDYVGIYKDINAFNDFDLKNCMFYFLFLIIYLFFAVKLLIKGKIKGFALLSFFISLLPVMQVFYHTEHFADHYIYFPSIFMFLFITDVIKNIDLSRLKFYLIFIILILGFETFDRTKIYLNEHNYWSNAYKKNAKSFRVLKYVGSFALSSGDFKNAERFLNNALKEVKNYKNPLADTYQQTILLDLIILNYNVNKIEKSLNIINELLVKNISPEIKDKILAMKVLCYIKMNNIKGVYETITTNIYFDYPKNIFFDYLIENNDKNEMKSFLNEVEKINQNDRFVFIKKTILYESDVIKLREKYKVLSKDCCRNFFEMADIAEIEIRLGLYENAFNKLLLLKQLQPSYSRTDILLTKLKELNLK